jgi:hypothetical protein
MNPALHHPSEHKSLIADPVRSAQMTSTDVA